MSVELSEEEAEFWRSRVVQVVRTVDDLPGDSIAHPGELVLVSSTATMYVRQQPSPPDPYIPEKRPKIHRSGRARRHHR